MTRSGVAVQPHVGQRDGVADVFTGQAGNDTFTNLTAIVSRADGGAGADVLRGGSTADELIGGDGERFPQRRRAKDSFGDLVTGQWRYMTPDKIQVWARWCYPSADVAVGPWRCAQNG